MRRIISICKEVPLLPIAIIAAIPLALLGSWRPWEAAGVSLTFGPFNPGVGQWIVIALVVYTIVVTVIGMIDDLRHGHVGVDLLAVIAIASTVAVQEYWAAWAVVLMISSGEAIEEFAQSKAESNLTALVDAAPRTAHVVTLPGVRGHVHTTGGEHAADVTEGGFRKVAGAGDSGVGGSAAYVSVSGESDKPGTKPYDAAGEHFETVPVDQVKLGDVILVLPGETVPVDGELLSGVATLDLSNINGEPVPREVYAGARVLSGAVNGSTALTMRATQLAQDSQYQKILELVSSAQQSRPTVVKTADVLAVPFTILSLAIAGIAWAVAGTPLRFAQVLVLATPCPLLIAGSRRVRGRHRSPCQGGHSYQSAGRAGKPGPCIAYLLRQNRHAYRQAAAGRARREAVRKQLAVRREPHSDDGRRGGRLLGAHSVEGHRGGRAEGHAGTVRAL